MCICRMERGPPIDVRRETRLMGCFFLFSLFRDFFSLSFAPTVHSERNLDGRGTSGRETAASVGLGVGRYLADEWMARESVELAEERERELGASARDLRPGAGRSVGGGADTPEGRTYRRRPRETAVVENSFRVVGGGLCRSPTPKTQHNSLSLPPPPHPPCARAF